ncbi:DUF2779 domain-containing protein [Ramlibacter sp. USB13]|uniref:DUF2779 domain-containing protein n=1 Tax=Ramlibacter cellulosilyticus TaxID=2764187 RepID=A0A923SE68_9BURK|nr:DUF2779 domain-containing protein [Ramlibacter cellulosilyticus]MBC5782637.1 DUF2779 domain-containing protein [Ramlibacter cellulosilyticus]
MSTRPRYLTKSRFKLAVECPTKLHYTGKPAVYPDAKSDDEFLQALAEGGFQVGELAKLMFPGGIEVTAATHDAQVAETDALLQRDEVTIFEAAIRHGNFFVRVDILRKMGTQVELIEVKAKSFDSTDPHAFRAKRGGIVGEMLPYLQDIAFQRHVFALAYPGLQARCSLMMADKSKAGSVDGLNQMFRIRRDGRQARVEVRAAAIGEPVLTCADVEAEVQEILVRPLKAPGAPAGATLASLAQEWSERYVRDERIAPVPGARCAHCEFRVDAPVAGQRSGFHECWQQAFGMGPEGIARGTVLDLWNFRKKAELMERGVVALADVTPDMLGEPSASEGLGAYARQCLQIRPEWPGGGDFYLDRELLRREMGQWEYPLHMIDFETARVALPYFAGQRPYENIAFQFSHHTIAADGAVAHANEFLVTTPGQRPNYDFARALARAVGARGTVFMWSPHENTTLVAILKELEADPHPTADAPELMAFLRSLTRRKIDAKRIEVGDRAMVDLCDLAERAFFHPSTRGSCSIKKVLPAVLRSSAYLRGRYSQPVYGAAGGVPSLNFREQVWWVREANGGVKDPYKLLAPVFDDVSLEADDEESSEFGEIRAGGAATMAYARLQFGDVAAADRGRVEAALKRYCELDTLAMVMVLEAWREECKQR